jgi:DNA polymerase III alpha subunit
MNSAIELYDSAQKHGVKPIVGIELYVEPFFKEELGAMISAKTGKTNDQLDAEIKKHYTHLTVHFKDEWAYQYFCRLTPIMESRAIVKWGERKPICTLEELRGAAGHITVCSGCLISSVHKWLDPLRDKVHIRTDLAEKAYCIIREIAGADSFFVEVFPHRITHNWKKAKIDNKTKLIIEPGRFEEIGCSDLAPEGDIQKTSNQLSLYFAQKYNDPVIISLDSHFATQEQKLIQDARLGNGMENWRFHESLHIMTTDEAAETLTHTLGVDDKTVEGWVDNSYKFASLFDNFKMTTNKDRWVLDSVPENFMKKLVDIIQRHGRMNWQDPDMVTRLKYEISVLANNGTINLIPYFFTLEEIAEHCRDNNILLNVRGSAGGSLLLYVIGVSAVNPLKHNLSFERFLTLGRIKAKTLPDADLDLPTEDRDRVIQYLEAKYGDRICRISVDIQLKIKSSLKDAERSIIGSVSKETEAICKMIPKNINNLPEYDFVFGHTDDDGVYHKGLVETHEKFKEYIQKKPKIWEMTQEMLGINRQKSQHPCIDANMLVETNDGIKMLCVADNLKGNPITKWSTGIKDCIRVVLSNGVNVVTTPDHRYMMTDGSSVEAQHVVNRLANYQQIDKYYGDDVVNHDEAFAVGWLLRDGWIHKNGQVTLCFTPDKDNAAKDKIISFCNSILCKSWQDHRVDKVHFGIWPFLKNWGFIKNRLPCRFWLLNKKAQDSFMSGLWSANGFVLSTRRVVGIKLSKLDLISDIAVWLSAVGIKIRCTIEQPKSIKWNNGDYQSTTSICLNICTPEEIVKFSEHISFIQNYKQNRMKQISVIDRSKKYIRKTPLYKPVVYKKILSIGLREVYDFNEPIYSTGRINGVLVHNCGYVIADKPVQDYIPITQVGPVKVTGFTPKSVEKAGLIKYDFLGLNTLRDIQGCLRLINNRRGVTIDPWNLPQEEEVYKLFHRGETETVFQFDTDVVRPFLMSIKPVNLDGLAAITALARPGTLDALDMDGRTLADVYVARAKGEPIKYVHPDMAPILQDTYGTCVFQEQSIRIYQDIAGYTAEEAETVRRGIGKKDAKVLAESTKILKQRCLAKGWSEGQVKLLVDQIMASARYSFNQSHATSYAYVAYACMYLKMHYPLEWWTTVLTNASKEDLQKYWPHVSSFVLLPDINISGSRFEIVNVDGVEKVRAPLGLIDGVGEVSVNEAMTKRPFKSLDDFLSRVDRRIMRKDIVHQLILADAMNSLFPSNFNHFDKIREYEFKKAALAGKKTPDEAPSWLLSMSSIQAYLMKKSVFKVYNEDIYNLSLNKLLAEKLIEADRTVPGLYKYRDSDRYIDGKIYINHRFLEQSIMSDRGGWTDKHIFAVVGYVNTTKEHRYNGLSASDKSVTTQKTMMKITAEIGPKVYGIVKFPDYKKDHHGIDKDIKGSICLFVLQKKKDGDLIAKKVICIS